MAGPTKWGIISTGMISSDFVQAVKGLPCIEHQVVAVAARKQADADSFAKRYDIPKAYNSYEDLAKDPNVDIVYIGTLIPYHHTVTMMVLNHGKNVLCEKPLGMNYQQSKEMIDLAKKKGVFFMEGLWSRFYPVYQKLREELNNKTIGKANFVSASFGGNLQEYSRIKLKSQGGGCVLDLGVYVIQMALLVYNHEEPEKIVASGILTDEGVDYCDSITMYFKDKRVAQLNIHQESVLNNYAVISGDKGVIEIPKLWCPHEITTPDGQTHQYPIPDIGKTNYLHGGGFQYEAQAVRECLLQGKLEHELHPHSATLLVAKCMDEVLRQVGVTY